MLKLIVASNNAGKIKEIKELSKGKFNVVSLKEAGIDIDIEETGKIFEENALIKARAIFKMTGENVLSDDSGLCVEALGGAPGVYSARYSGEQASDQDNIDLILQNLTNQTNRKAKFVSCVAFISKDGTQTTTWGETEGEILFKREGTNGFGYDPVFYSYDLKQSFGKASNEDKNSVSHRARALKKLFESMLKL